MHLWLTCSGVVIGAVEFELAEGIAHAPVNRTAGYEIAAAAAEALGLQFLHTQFWSPLAGDFAEEAASRWTGGRLALEDDTGRELGVNNIVVLARQGREIQVVADFRPDMARVDAFLNTIGPGGSGRTRPAA